MFSRLFFLTVFVMLSFSVTATAQQQRFDSAEATDPNKLKWMQGFPPPADKIITHPESDFFSFPKLRWTVCHIRELLPTTPVSRGLSAPAPLPEKLDSEIDNITFKRLDNHRELTWKQSLTENYTDGILILHKDVIVYEEYAGCLNEERKHAAMSMTKSLTGLLAEILVAEGTLNEQATVASIVPELAESAFADATVRQVMDMTTGLDYSENYEDPNADIWIYSAASNPLPKPDTYTGPVGYYEYLQTVKKAGEHGKAFGYKTINSDVLGWIIARVSGSSVAQLLSAKIWKNIGAEQDAYMTIDSKGTPFAGGGLSAGLRDMARVGQLMLNEGTLNNERLFPLSVVEQIRKGGDKAAFSQANYRYLEGASYRSMWWVLHNKHQAFAARGVHGQTIYVDPTADMVIVRFASHPLAKNTHTDPTSLPAYQAVAEYLLSCCGKHQANADAH